MTTMLALVQNFDCVHIYAFAKSSAHLMLPGFSLQVLNCERKNEHSIIKVVNIRVWASTVPVAWPAGKNCWHINISGAYNQDLQDSLERTVFKLFFSYFEQIAAVVWPKWCSSTAISSRSKNLHLDHVFLSFQPIWGKHRHISRTHVWGSYIYHFVDNI